MKLYWSPRSPFVRKVMVFAHETGLAERIERVPTDVSMTQPNRDLMRNNPVGKIPTLLTDAGEVLYDSTLICEFLDFLHTGPKLFPAAGESRWKALRRHALANNLMDALVLWRNERLRPAAQVSAELMDAFALKLQASLTELDHDAASLAAAPFGIGHIAIGCALGYSDYRFADQRWRDGHAPIAEWYESFAARPSAKKTVPSD